MAELVNKINGPWFSKFDEDLATAFSIYCGISIAHVSGDGGGDSAGPSALLSTLGLRAPLLVAMQASVPPVTSDLFPT